MSNTLKQRRARRQFLAIGLLGSLALLLKRRRRLTPPETEFVQVMNAQGELVEVPRSALENRESKEVRSKRALRTWLQHHGRQI
ncbi:MAG: hypothetical protein R3330_04415 [Saprospiraceae bacterium]|nr:hypothetical protein [Saprospiraceae bacterium]